MIRGKFTEQLDTTEYYPVQKTADVIAEELTQTNQTVKHADHTYVVVENNNQELNIPINTTKSNPVTVYSAANPKTEEKITSSSIFTLGIKTGRNLRQKPTKSFEEIEKTLIPEEKLSEWSNQLESLENNHNLEQNYNVEKTPAGYVGTINSTPVTPILDTQPEKTRYGGQHGFKVETPFSHYDLFFSHEDKEIGRRIKAESQVTREEDGVYAEELNQWITYNHQPGEKI